MTKQSNFTNGDTSNLSGIEKYFINLVNEGKLQQMPANYDCATLKMYISHLEKENTELKAQLKNIRLMTMADGTIKQLYSVEEVEHIVKERDELKARLEKAVELPCIRKVTNGNPTIYEVVFISPNSGFVISDKFVSMERAEQRLAELKGGKE